MASDPNLDLERRLAGLAERRAVGTRPVERRAHKKRGHPAAGGRVLAAGLSTSAFFGVIAALSAQAPASGTTAVATAPPPASLITAPVTGPAVATPSTASTTKVVADAARGTVTLTPRTTVAAHAGNTDATIPATAATDPTSAPASGAAYVAPVPGTVATTPVVDALDRADGNPGAATHAHPHDRARRAGRHNAADHAADRAAHRSAHDVTHDRLHPANGSAASGVHGIEVPLTDAGADGYWIERRSRAMGTTTHVVIGDAPAGLDAWAFAEIERLEQCWTPLPPRQRARVSP